MDSLQPFSSTSVSGISGISGIGDDQRLTRKRIQLRVPKRYQQDPIISHLISDYHLTVNIAAALLSANAREDGWFDLDIQGTVPQIQSALLYLNDLDLEVWHESEPESW